MEIPTHGIFSHNDEFSFCLTFNVQGTVAGTAQKMRLSDFIMERVATRTIPEITSTRKPSVLMKLDIEGSELEVLTDLIVTGALSVR